MKVYISGKISGDRNYQLKFLAAEKKLRELGFEALNPARINAFNNETAFKEAVKMLLEADAIYLLQDWKNSAGSRIELDIALYLKLQILHQKEN